MHHEAHLSLEQRLPPARSRPVRSRTTPAGKIRTDACTIPQRSSPRAVHAAFDSVIVTKIGIADSYDVKAFGDCINVASHYANETENKVKVSKKVENEWPSSKGGRIHFTSIGNGEAFYLESNH